MTMKVAMEATRMYILHKDMRRRGREASIDRYKTRQTKKKREREKEKGKENEFENASVCKLNLPREILHGVYPLACRREMS